MKFELTSQYSPSGDQNSAINFLVKGLKENIRDQILLGITGSGKTFTVANIIQQTQKPTLIMTHNKTLAAQIYTEMQSFFPKNAVEYFVSYYDYYQPEAYVAHSNTYIEKTSAINEDIDRMRHSATRSLLEKKDVIIVASVSCIYSIGPIESYADAIITLEIGTKISQQKLCRQLADLQYQRNNLDFKRGIFRATGEAIEIFPAHKSNTFWKINFFGNEIEDITEIEYPSRKKLKNLPQIKIFSNSHHIANAEIINQAIEKISIDLQIRLKELKLANKLVEYQRLEQKTLFDIEMMQATGSCSGIENYSRYLTGRPSGSPPPTIIEYLPDDALMIVDESHVSLPQIKGMFLGDQSRKTNLSEHGFRLPSCMDNRPLKFEEWDMFRPQTIYLSATPSNLELTMAGSEHIVEQLIRPTGILDPVCTVKPTENQIDDLIDEIKKTTEKNLRVLVTTITKKMAEQLTEYLFEHNINVTYMHSDTETLDRIQIISSLKSGEFDVLVGINLLREGLDIPECGLVAILDADKEGFLRSKTSLIQTIGRAARNTEGRVILYADKITKSMKEALDETSRRREIQEAHNIKHNITPVSIVSKQSPQQKAHPITKISTNDIAILQKKMMEASDNLKFEEAAEYRDKIKKLTAKQSIKL